MGAGFRKPDAQTRGRRGPCENGDGRGSAVATKVAEALRRLREDGWRITSQVGNHRQFEHPTKPGTVTVSGKPSETIAPGTWNNMQKQAG